MDLSENPVVNSCVQHVLGADSIWKYAPADFAVKRKQLCKPHQMEAKRRPFSLLMPTGKVRCMHRNAAVSTPGAPRTFPKVPFKVSAGILVIRKGKQLRAQVFLRDMARTFTVPANSNGLGFDYAWLGLLRPGQALKVHVRYTQPDVNRPPKLTGVRLVGHVLSVISGKKGDFGFIEGIPVLNDNLFFRVADMSGSQRRAVKGMCVATRIGSKPDPRWKGERRWFSVRSNVVSVSDEEWMNEEWMKHRNTDKQTSA